MTEQKLEAISARAEAATPGPWETVECRSTPAGVSWTKEATICARRIRVASLKREIEGDVGSAGFPSLMIDAKFIAAARTDVPALIAALREANAKIIRLERSYH